MHGCSSGPPSSAASAAEAALPGPRSPRASFLSGLSPAPGSRRRLSRFTAFDMALFRSADVGDRKLKRARVKNLWFILLSQKHLILHALLFIKNTKISKGFFPSRDLARSPRGGLMRERTAEVRPSPEEQSVGTGMPTRPNLDQRSPIGCSPRRRAHRTAGR